MGDLIILNPFEIYKQVAILIKGVFTASLPANNALKVIDGLLLASTFGALAFAGGNGLKVILNLRE